MIDYPEQNKLCLSEVDSDPHQDLKSNLTGFLILFVNHTITNFNISVSFLQNQVNSGKLDRDMKDIYMFEACIGDFQLGIDDLRETFAYVTNRKKYNY